jgi:ribonuclease HII
MSEPIGTFSPICGIDEVGRGPLAGPVTAAAVVLIESCDLSLLGDSKALSEKRRERAFAALTGGMCRYGIGWVSPREIDELNIHRATLLAMERAWMALTVATPGLTVADIHVDGRFCPSIEGPPCTAIVGGDRSDPAIMAASIVAKVARDRWMVEYARKDDRYDFGRHKGYPTAAHREALRQHGPSPIHRRSFRGVLPEPPGQPLQ